MLVNPNSIEKKKETDTIQLLSGQKLSQRAKVKGMSTELEA